MVYLWRRVALWESNVVVVRGEDNNFHDPDPALERVLPLVPNGKGSVVDVRE